MFIGYHGKKVFESTQKNIERLDKDDISRLIFSEEVVLKLTKKFWLTLWVNSLMDIPPSL